MPSLARAIRFLIVGVCAACTPGERPPSAPVQGTLAAGAERSARGDTGPFRVVFAAPKGEASSAAELSLVFSRSLRGLDANAEAPPPPIAIAPLLEGRWLWVGARALRFVPASPRLPGSTRYSVTVSGDTRAVDGARLGSPYRFDFETPRVAVVRSTPNTGEEHLELDTRFELELNQPIEPARFERGATLWAERGGKKVGLAFAAERPRAEHPKKLIVRPKAPLPKDSAIRLEIGEALVGEEGPLPAKPRALEFRTYGPLRVDRVDCDRSSPSEACAPGGFIGVVFSNPVKLGELRRAVTLTPPGRGRLGYGADEDFTEYLDVSAGLQAGRSYTLRVAGGLVDRHGQKLGADDVRRLEVADHPPRIEIGVSGDTLPPGAGTAIPVGSINVGTYELVTAPVRPEDLLAILSARGNRVRQNIVAKLPRATSRNVVPKGERNRSATENVAILPVLGAERGVLAVAVSHPPVGKRFGGGDDFRLLKVSDLAVSAKVSRHGSLVWVTRLGTAAPVGGATVELLRAGTAVRSYPTDSQGIAKIPASDFAPNLDVDNPESRAVLVVRSGADWTYSEVSDHLDTWRLSVPVDLSGTQRTYGMLFTERGVYRPGDTVKVKGVVRQETPQGNATVSGRKVEVVLSSPDDEVVQKATVTTTRFGTFALDVVVPHSASLGSWRLRAPGLGGSALEHGFEVAEYRPAEFKVDARSEAPSYLRGVRARFSASGDYLFGAPMAGADVQYFVTRAATSWSVPGADGFVTDAGRYYADRTEAPMPSGSLASGKAKLDARGVLPLDVPLDLPGQRGTELVRLDAEVSDVSRQAISGSASAVVHPADTYVGLGEPEDFLVAAPGVVSPRVVTFAPDGARVTGRKVRVELTQRRWTLAREVLPDGSTRSLTQVVDTVVGTCEVTTAAAPATCALSVQKGGYHLVVARSTDGKGRVAEAAFGLYALGGGEASGTAFGDNDRRAVELVPNRKQYKVGETAKVLVKSPFPEAEALVTVERAGVYRAERVKLRGPTPTVSVPITEDLRPNAFVAVHMIRSRGGRASGDVPYRLGYAELAIDREARRLRVEVKPSAKELRPGDDVSVDLAVRGHDGKAVVAEVTVYAVDEGVLMLTNYRTPDPLPVFTAARPLQVATLETRESLAKLSLDAFEASLGADKGAEGGGGGEGGARRDFRQVAYWNPSVVTDGSGRASVRFKLPESLTTYRIMAVAASAGDEYGFGQASVLTNRRLMARPNLPRFLRAGDRIDAGIVLASKGLDRSKIAVRLTATGAAVEGAKVREVDLGRDESVEVRFAIHADTAGEVKLRFDVAGGGERDAVEVTRQVRVPGFLETVALYGSTEGVSAERLSDASTLRADAGGLEVKLASSALVGLDGSAAQLAEYPYACTEQLSSRLVPLLPLRDLARGFGFPAAPDGVIGRTLGEILGRQRGDGGFGMWPESTESSPWVSAYATWAIDQAALHGGRVPKLARDRAHDYLRRYLATLNQDLERRATAAFVVDVLAEGGAPDPGYMAKLFEERAALPLFARALLLHAFAVSKGSRGAISELARSLASELRISNDTAFAAENTGDEYATLFDSTTRTGALVLRALLSSEPKHPLGAPLARGLLSQRSSGTWRSTQETAYALLALDAYRRAQEARPASFVATAWLGGRALRTAKFEGGLTSDTSLVPMSRVASLGGGTLTFEKDGPGTLFYEARLTYARRTLPAAPLDLGFFVQKALRPVEPASLPAALETVASTGPTRFPAGSLVLADLVLVTPSPRDYVVLDDPLPAGLEAVDANLATTAAWLDVGDSAGGPGADPDCQDCESTRDRRAHGRGFSASWHRREVRDDRVLFFVDHMPAGIYHYRYLARATTRGTFVVPPAKAEEMYTPETYGRTAAATVVVE